MENIRKYITDMFRVEDSGGNVEEVGAMVNREWETIFDAIDDWVCVIDLNATILRSNISGEKFSDLPVKNMIGLKCCPLVHGAGNSPYGCPLSIMIETGKRESIEIQNGDGRWMSITVDPVFDNAGKLVKAVHIVRDITQTIWIQNEREKLIKVYKEALAKIKTLNGLLPICAICKKIRDDQGEWNRIENYITTHTNAEFTHTICPGCARIHYGELNVGNE